MDRNKTGENPRANPSSSGAAGRRTAFAAIQIRRRADPVATPRH